MACLECAARLKLARDALLSAKIKEALGHVVKGAAEIAGFKPKTALEESGAAGNQSPGKGKKAQE